MEQYKNKDGTYTSPKNGKTYPSLRAFTAHWYYAGTSTPDNFAKRLYKVACQYCNYEIGISNKAKHEKSCYLHPQNIMLCEVCNEPVKDYQHSKGTCSRKCANTYFRSGKDNGNYTNSINTYAALCFKHHEKRCVVCNEADVIDVHHLDSNKENNSIENLIPLCPTHHAYCHRGLFTKIEKQIQEYLKDFKNNSV